MPCRAILCDWPPTSSLPSKRMEPVACGGAMPMIALQSVVLPMPFRPTIAREPRSIVKLRSSSTRALP